MSETISTIIANFMTFDKTLFLYKPNIFRVSKAQKRYSTGIEVLRKGGSGEMVKSIHLSLGTGFLSFLRNLNKWYIINNLDAFVTVLSPKKVSCKCPFRWIQAQVIMDLQLIWL